MTSDEGDSAGKGSARNGAGAAPNMGKGVEAAADYAARKKIIDRLEQIDVGIIDCDLAVAHTGTLLLPHTADRNGLTNLLPWTCIAIVWHSQIVSGYGLRKHRPRSSG